MRLITLLLASVFISAPALAQKSQSSKNTQGVQIQGNTELKAKQENASAVAQGEGNVAKNAAGAIRGGTQIQGNTKIKAAQKNVTAVASGRANSAGNEAGTIGDAAPVAQPQAERQKLGGTAKPMPQPKPAVLPPGSLKPVVAPTNRNP